VEVLPEFVQLRWQDNVVPVTGLRNSPTAKGYCLNVSQYSHA